LNDTGYIVAVLGTNTSSANAYQLYSGSGVNADDFEGFEVAYYAPSLGSVGFNFSGLQSGTTYNLFLAGTNDDPTALYPNITAVTTLQLTTLSPPSENGLALFCSVIMALVAMISILV